MEVEFRKDLKHNYMIIATAQPLRIEPYCLRVLQQQTLAGILSFKQSQLDDKCLHYYEITGKQSLPNMLERSLLSCDNLRDLLEHILEALELAYEYLLTEDDFILSPEQIFLDVVTNSPYLCYLSGYHKDCKEQMNSLLEYLLNKVDYSDREAVLLVYRLYAISKEEGFTFTHLREALLKRPEEVRYSSNRTSGDSYKIRKPEASGNTEEAEQASEEETSSSLNQIPVVWEEERDEKEVRIYPTSVYLFTGIGVVIGILILILCFTTGLLYDPYKDRLEYSRLLGILLILLCVEAYAMRKIWNRDNQIAKIVTKSEYIDPRSDYTQKEDEVEAKPHPSFMKGKEPAASSYLTKREYQLWESLAQKPDYPSDSIVKAEPMTTEREKISNGEDINPTCILNDTVLTKEYELQVLLQSLEENKYPSIVVKEFPFFIGKLRKNVDYFIDKSVVSRYHAKITKENATYFITDLNSTNGTYVNETILQTYEKREIRQGDKIALANLRFEFLVN